MGQGQRFRIGARLASFRYALRGLRLLLGSQHNAWIHAVATAAACALGVLLGISAWEWCAVVLAVVAVWVAEALNTAFELLCDAVAPERSPQVERAKDVAAAAVLVAAAGALMVGLFVFGPALLRAAA